MSAMPAARGLNVFLADPNLGVVSGLDAPVDWTPVPVEALHRLESAR